MSAIRCALFCILSALLLSACFPPFDYSFAAWIALVPLLIALRALPTWSTFPLAYLMGLTFSGMYLKWLTEIQGMPFVAFLAIAGYSALWFGLFGLLFRLLLARTRWSSLVLAPSLWVTIEFARSTLSFLATPWGLLGHTQHDTLALLQLASVTSVYGLSFLIVLVNAALADGVLWLLARRLLPLAPPPATRVLSSIALAFMILLVVAL